MNIEEEKIAYQGKLREEDQKIELAEGNIIFSIDPQGWTNGNVTVTIEVNKTNEEDDLNNFELQYSKDLKTWTTYTEEITSTKNETIYARIRHKTTKQIKATAAQNIENIDTTKPTASIASSNVTTKGFELNVTTEDTESGLSTIKWYYKKTDASSWTSIEKVYKELHSSQAGTTTQVTKSNTDKSAITGLTSGTYQAYAEVTDVAGNTTTTSTITITTGTVTTLDKELATPNITFTHTNADGTTGWTNGKVTVSASTTVTGFTLQTSKDASTWSNSTSQEYTANGSMYAVLTDGTNYGGAASEKIGNIDTTAPTVNTALQVKSSTTNSKTLSVEVTDSNSGLGKIIWYYKKSGASSYSSTTSTYTTLNGTTTGTTKNRYT